MKREERKPVPTQEILNHDRHHDPDHVRDTRDTAASRAGAPVVVERAPGAHVDRPADADHPTHVDHPAHAPHPTPSSLQDPAHDVLFPNEESVGYRSRWEAIQTGFVDEPRAAVEQADALVAQITSRLTEVFTRERQTLEQQWGRGDNVSTEDLRIALKRYRAFFDRLLSM